MVDEIWSMNYFTLSSNVYFRLLKAHALVVKSFDKILYSWKDYLPLWSFRTLQSLSFCLCYHKTRVAWSLLLLCVVLVALVLFTQQFATSPYNEIWGLKKSAHSWRCFTTSAQPHYCTSCRQLVFGFWMFRSTGWECTVCRRTAHTRCLRACNTYDCKYPSQSNPLRHQLAQGNLPSGSLCCVCGILCWSPFGLLGLRCLWCDRTLHEECASKLCEACDLGHFQQLVLPPTLVRLSFLPTSYFSSLRSFLTATKHSLPFPHSHSIEKLSPTQITKQPNVDLKLRSPSFIQNQQSLLKKLFLASSGRVHGPGRGQHVRAEATQLLFPSTFYNKKDLHPDASLHTDQQCIVYSVDKGERLEKEKNVFENSSQCVEPPNKRSDWHFPLEGIPRRFKNRMHELAYFLPTKANVWEIVLNDISDSVVHVKQSNFLIPAMKSSTGNPLHIQRDKRVSEKHRRLSLHARLPIALRNCRPLLVFVNTKSGGQTSAQLFKELYRYLNPIQVIDIQLEEGPQRALEAFRALAELDRLRILVCGGDGTAGWVLDELQNVYGPPNQCRVPVALLPLGTGNDLAHVLGWGQDFDGNLFQFLKKVQLAQLQTLDLWNIRVTPHGANEPLIDTTFNNYVDIGVAAKIALKFHELREAHPELFQSRLGNKFLYGEMGFREWVTDKNRNLGDLKVWCDGVPVVFPEKKIQGLIIVNIPSFSGGINLWDIDHPDQSYKCIDHLDNCNSGLSCSFHRQSSSDPLNETAVCSRRVSRSKTPVQLRYCGALDSKKRYIRSTYQSPCSMDKSLLQTVDSTLKNSSAYHTPDSSASSLKRSTFSVCSPSNVFQLKQPKDYLPVKTYQGVKYYKNSSHSQHGLYKKKTPNHSSILHFETDECLESFSSCSFSKQNKSNTQNLPVTSTHQASWNNNGIGSCIKRFRHETRHQWKKQSIRDGIIEVVAVRSLFHLGQIQVGLAEPLRVCQGHAIKVHVPAEVPLQINGEPKMVPACTIEISYRSGSYVLSPRDPLEGAMLNTVTEVLDSAVSSAVLTLNQRDLLYREFSKRL